MSDVVIVVPRGLWQDWLSEGHAAGDPDEGRWVDYYFRVPTRPRIEAGERVYVVAGNRVRGWAPLVRVESGGVPGRPTHHLVRQGGATACTIPADVKGYQGYRYRWWDRAIEVPFPDWRTL